jgi:hypothetical protein
MKKFFTTLMAFSIVPLLVFIPYVYFYCKRDVYQDLGSYENYSWKYTYEILGDLSTKKLLQSDIKYNSFIFGSSRSIGLYACYLQNHIKNSKFYHYANWGERIEGIYNRIKLLDALHYNLDNAIIYIDTDCTFEEDGSDQDDHYLLTNKNRIEYYLEHFLSFFPPKLTKTKFDILFFDHKPLGFYPNWKSDIYTNDPQHTCSDSIIRTYGLEPLTEIQKQQADSLKKIGFFYKRPEKQTYNESVISDPEYAMLKGIKTFFDKHHTRYYIIITPGYDQLKFNKHDFNLILKTFGAQNVYDFSGINAITDNEKNYPDRIHFTPNVSKYMADSAILHIKNPKLYK